MAKLRESKVPDIGDFDEVPVIEIIAKAGDEVAEGDSLVTLESDKATMEVPAECAGIIKEIKVKVDDNVAEGSVIAMIEPANGEAYAPADDEAEAEAESESESESGDPSSSKQKQAKDSGQGNQSKKTADADQGEGQADETASQDAPDKNNASKNRRDTASQPLARTGADTVMPDRVPFASPVVRAYARELGVDLKQVQGSGDKGRITREDVKAFVKKTMSGAGGVPASGSGLSLLPWPDVDFSKYGETETKPLSRINKLSAANLARNWAMIPHVTQFEEADITDLETLRKQLNTENKKADNGIKVTMLAFLIKACVASLKQYPRFNSSLDTSGENLIHKKYFNIGFAADTPNGLVVPVIKAADQKGVLEIAEETAALATKARDGKLGPGDMAGGCFSISSLGGIGGTAFTPIINAPEVAILGVSRTQTRVVWDEDSSQPVPRLMLPLSLSYDHRVIDGALAARFCVHLATLLNDLRRALV